MLPRLHPQRPRLESSIEVRDSGVVRVVDAESDEPLSPEDEKRRRAYAEWLARFESRNDAA
jgi:hypothetical protein